MNQQERNTLREKHTLEPYEDRITGQEVATCARCCTDEWPCDVIKVLDAWVEAELIATPPPCKHIVGTEIPPTATNPEFQWFDYTYCPKCGEKL